MKYRLLTFTLLIMSLSIHGQTISDYKEYIKEKLELYPTKDYQILVNFGNEQPKADVEILVGKKLTFEELPSLFVHWSIIGGDGSGNGTYIIKVIDVKGLRKITTSKETESVVFTLYPKDGYLCTVYAVNPEPRDKIQFAVKTSYEIATKIKKSFIELAKLLGAKDIIDGDNLFNDN